MIGKQVVPTNWRWTTVSELCQVEMGSSPPGESYNTSGEGVPLVNGPVEFGKGPLDKTVITQFTTKPLKYCREGELLLCVRGSTTGRTNIAGFRAAIGRGVAAINAGQCQRFVNYYLVSCRDDIYSKGAGSTFPNITTGTLLSYPIPIAPLNEQRRIVAKIEELFSDLDAAVAMLERVKTKLKRYRAAVLKAAIEGKLTAEWRERHRDTEPAASLLDRILKERRRRWEEAQLAKFKAADKEPPKGWQAKYQEPAAPDTTALPTLPEGWCWATFEALLSEPLRNGHSARATGDDSGIRTLTLTAVTLGDFSEKNTKLTIAKPEHVEDLWLQPGDFLIERSNTPGLVGTARLYRGPAGFAVFPDLLIRARTLTSLVKGYIDVVLQSHPTRTYFCRRAKGLAGSMPKIDQGTILGLPVPLPSLAEQAEIAEEVERRLSIAEEVEIQVEVNLKRAARLRQGILKRAFEGKLVPQDPTDEPAEQLLQRIQCNRALPRAKKRPSKPRPEAAGRRAKKAGNRPATDTGTKTRTRRNF